MRLLTKAILKKLPKIGTLENTPLNQQKIQVHYFHPFTNTDYYGIAYNPDNREFFGIVTNSSNSVKELTYFKLGELEKIRVYGLPIERETYWD